MHVLGPCMNLPFFLIDPLSCFHETIGTDPESPKNILTLEITFILPVLRLVCTVSCP